MTKSNHTPEKLVPDSNRGPACYLQHPTVLTAGADHPLQVLFLLQAVLDIIHCSLNFSIRGMNKKARNFTHNVSSRIRTGALLTVLITTKPHIHAGADHRHESGSCYKA
jgi:hypothetical protein